MKKSKFTDQQGTMVLGQAEAGTRVTELSQKLPTTGQTLCRWKKRFGGLMVPELRELRQPWEEDRRLKGLVADFSLDKEIFPETTQKHGNPCALA